MADEPKTETKPKTTDRLSQISSLVQLGIWLLVLAFVMWHWKYFGNWFSSATHVELPGGVKIDRFVEAAATVQEHAQDFKDRSNDRSGEFSLEFAQAAIVRAKRVAPALNGALILWVDENWPVNNKVEESILEDLGIRIINALSTAEGMERLDRDHYDLIISNVGRKETPEKLKLCEVHYFDWPNPNLRETFKDDLIAFNVKTNNAAPGGFGFMEKVNAKYGSSAPPIIFYSASSGGIATSLCSNTITNRTDILLQAVVTKLEEQRWQELR